MNMRFSQADRLGRLSTIFGDDTLVLLRFDGTDHLNDLFEYRIEALAPSDDLDFDALIGTHATVEIEGRAGLRAFDGIVTTASWAGVGENGHRYDLTLRPWFWLASLRRNQRIFHRMTVVQIIEDILAPYADLGDPALEIRLARDYPELEYTVQFRESDMNFVRRQMERHGLSFHFQHRPGSHTMIVTDDVTSHDSVGERPFKSYDGHHQYEHEHFWDWKPERNMTTGAVRLTDFNFKQPDQAMEVDRIGDALFNRGQIESFDYPGDFLTQGAGKLVAAVRAAQERGTDRRNRAVGDCVSLGSGLRLTLTGDRVPGTGAGYLCLSASHHFVSEAYGSGGQGSDGYAFTGSYTMMPETAPLAPPRRTPVPQAQGPQTAIVVGEGEIDCDDHGRILVRFHWDLAGAISMRCRVSQNWAGGNWGGMVIPRVGMEVLVDFLDGDPDKPIVVGNVFNGKNAAPYALPANKTRMVLRSQTHQGAGFNELSFEDQAGSEEVFLHGQKDHRIQIGNDQNQTIGNNRTKTVANKQTESVGSDKSISVGGNHSESITGDKTLSVTGSHTETITGDMGVTVTGSRNETVKSARSVSVTGDNSTTVEQGSHAVTVKTGDHVTQVDSGNHLTTVKSGAMQVSVLAAGHYTTAKDDVVTVSEAGGIAIKAKTSVVIEAPTILLKAASGNFIQIGDGQIVIEGPETYINPRVTAPDTGGSSPAGGATPV